MTRLLLFLLSVLLATPASSFTAKELRVTGNAHRTRLEIDLDGHPQFGILRLTDPDRLVVDLADVEFSSDPEPGKGRGLIKDFRYGLIAPGKARVVLDLQKPVQVKASSFEDGKGDAPSRLIVELEPTTRQAFRESASHDSTFDPSVKPSETQAAAAPQPGDKPVVVLDPGHGGIDSGAIAADGTKEKNLTLPFGVMLSDILKQDGKVDAILTRSTDDFLSLSERVKFAEAHKAALFVSIHADKVPEDYVSGSTVYTVSEKASDRLSAVLAEQENRSDVLAGLAIDDQPKDVADILFDLARRETKNISVRFAKTLMDEDDSPLKFSKTPWRRASFQVLRSPDVPSVLVELGFLSNKDDEALLKSEEWRHATALAIARAIENFLAPEVAAAPAGTSPAAANPAAADPAAAGP
ncbi:N-acetylmuramoyl-L-alanine amidase [Faunimonas pinastri]|uniref:N-acetylmuramoyl-L-alanine amidase n=1 Tax=Faunimonas pinastri TaxID=1855383 RepID=A0A1H9CY60_9HYPH|nr:N-acetylmuramoyl-L-alanine amidase [Faunimonas pinastri]SEQ06057.1 N-acetylmuramoyl-L-alanine amidase [Faunimonas pinastri]